MFTTWDQVKAWIEDNNFPRWIFYKNDPEEREAKDNDAIIDSNNFTVSDMDDKLAMTEKYLRMYGGKVYGVGFKTPNGVQGGFRCEVRIQEEAQPQSMQGIGGSWQEQIGAMRESITREIRAEMEAQRYKDERAAFERERKEFEAEKQSAMGALVHYLAPVAQAMMAKRVMPKVAGVDTPGDIEAEPIHKIRTTQEPDPNTQELVDMANDFTDEEEEKLYGLLTRFKKVEPQYMELLEAVVTMAENGDATYTMAKGFLIK